MKYLSFWWMFQPSSFGRMTLCPRLETGKELGDALQQAQDDRLRVRDQRGEDHAGGAVRFGPLRNQAKTRAREPDEERRDAVLHVVVARAGLVPGEEAGSDFAGSAQ